MTSVLSALVGALEAVARRYHNEFCRRWDQRATFAECGNGDCSDARALLASPAVRQALKEAADA